MSRADELVTYGPDMDGEMMEMEAEDWVRATQAETIISELEAQVAELTREKELILGFGFEGVAQLEQHIAAARAEVPEWVRPLLNLIVPPRCGDQSCKTPSHVIWRSLTDAQRAELLRTP